MLTVNTRMAPVFNTRFNSSPKLYNTQTPSSSLPSMPAGDTFVRQNNMRDNISFGAYTNCPLVGRPDNEIDMLELRKGLRDKFNEVWDWAKNNEKYAPYFEKMNIEKPRIALLEGGKSIQLNHLEEEVGSYNWITNTIGINISNFPNVVAASKGEICLMPQNLSYFVIFAKDRDLDLLRQYLEVDKKDLRTAVENSQRWNNEKYYYKLTPAEATELAGPYFAHEIDHLIMTHVLFNTEGLSNNPNPARRTGNHAFQPYFEQLKRQGRFPNATSTRWEDSYAYKYRAKQPGMSVYSAEDKWELDAHHGFKKRIRLKDVLPMMFANPKKHMKNCLDLSGQCAALEYALSHKPKKTGDEATDNMMSILYDYQKAILEKDVEERKETVKVPKC